MFNIFYAVNIEHFISPGIDAIEYQYFIKLVMTTLRQPEVPWSSSEVKSESVCLNYANIDLYSFYVPFPPHWSIADVPKADFKFEFGAFYKVVLWWKRTMNKREGDKKLFIMHFMKSGNIDNLKSTF